jgi:hypothetical protein
MFSKKEQEPLYKSGSLSHRITTKQVYGISLIIHFVFFDFFCHERNVKEFCRRRER